MLTRKASSPSRNYSARRGQILALGQELNMLLVSLIIAIIAAPMVIVSIVALTQYLEAKQRNRYRDADVSGNEMADEHAERPMTGEQEPETPSQKRTRPGRAERAKGADNANCSYVRLALALCKVIAWSTLRDCLSYDLNRQSSDACWRNSKRREFK
jgi:hypothetical protein